VAVISHFIDYSVNPHSDYFFAHPEHADVHLDTVTYFLYRMPNFR